MWVAKTDNKDAAVKGGYRRTVLATVPSRQDADAIARTEADLHATLTGHTLSAPQVYVGRSFFYCDGCTDFCAHVAAGR